MSKKSFCIFLLVLLFNWAKLSAQSDEITTSLRPSKCFYATALDGHSLISLSLERLFLPTGYSFFTASVGLGVKLCVIECDSVAPFMLPMRISYHIGSKKSFLEIGLGSTWMSDRQNLILSMHPFLGFRWMQLEKGKVSIRLNVQYPLNTRKRSLAFSPVSIGIGKTF